jgi:hypothetical protein
VDNLVVGLSCWIIQDGNYGGFSVGDRPAFALEFYAPNSFEKFDGALGAMRTLTHVEDAHYDAVGEVVHVGDRWCVIDFGVLAYSDNLAPSGLSKGERVQGRVWIGIDPFPYFERLAALPDAPALIYDWAIDRIDMQTAPFIEVQPNFQQRDPNKLGWKSIDQTNAWEDDGSYAEYLLHCRRISRDARKTLNKS